MWISSLVLPCGAVPDVASLRSWVTRLCRISLEGVERSHTADNFIGYIYNVKYTLHFVKTRLRGADPESYRGVKN